MQSPTPLLLQPPHVTAAMAPLLACLPSQVGEALVGWSPPQAPDGGRGDLHHYVPLLDAIDAYLEGVLRGRADIELRPPEPGAPPDPPLPVPGLAAALRATTALLELCSNKHLYASQEVKHRDGMRRPARP